MTDFTVIMILQGERLDSPMGVGRRVSAHISSWAWWRFQKSIELNYCNTELKIQTNWEAIKYAYHPASPIPKITSKLKKQLQPTLYTTQWANCEGGTKNRPKYQERNIFQFSDFLLLYLSINHQQAQPLFCSHTWESDDVRTFKCVWSTTLDLWDCDALISPLF